MPTLTTGVSGGVAVTGQTTGVSLSALNDYGQIIISNAAPTEGPDTQGVLTISGTYGVGGVVSFQKVISPADFTAGNWTALSGVISRATGVMLGSNTYVLTANQGNDFSLPTVQGFYAVRVLLSTAPASGAVVVSGATFPGATGTLNPAVAAYYQQVGVYMAAVALALSDMNGTDYLAGVGGSF